MTMSERHNFVALKPGDRCRLLFTMEGGAAIVVNLEYAEACKIVTDWTAWKWKLNRRGEQLVTETAESGTGTSYMDWKSYMVGGIDWAVDMHKVLGMSIRAIEDLDAEYKKRIITHTTRMERVFTRWGKWFGSGEEWKG